MYLKDVLIVSDDNITATVLDCALSLDGYRVERVGDMRTAQAKAAAGRFDIAIVDMTTAGVEGYELCGKVNAARGSGFKCLIVLSDGEASGLAQLLEADYSLSKPLRVDMLLNIMNEIAGISELDCIYR